MQDARLIRDFRPRASQTEDSACKAVSGTCNARFLQLAAKRRYRSLYSRAPYELGMPILHTGGSATELSVADNSQGRAAMPRPYATSAVKRIKSIIVPTFITVVKAKQSH
jgi:hypothetical protein